MVSSDESPKFTTPEEFLAEANALEASGNLDEAAIARLNRRLEAEFEQRDREIKKELAEFEASIEEQRAAIRDIGKFIPRRDIPPITVIILVALGLLFLFTLGEHFVLASIDTYWSVAPWVFPAFSCGLFLLLIWRNKSTHSLEQRYPGVSYLNGIFTLFVVSTFVSTAIIFSLMGWLVLAGRITAGEITEMPGRILSIEKPTQSFTGCGQKARLEIGDDSAQICIAHRISGHEPKAGNAVIVSGRISRIGIYVEKIHLH